ncbi:Aldo/keto reductase [Lactarius psammicola]|nr:Aldo/keto reductase [Lactarius psammicola]
MGMKLDSPEVVITFPPIESIPDGPEDKPTPGLILEESIGPLHLPELISGAATWSHFYNKEETLSTDVPLRTIRLALRYGIRAFDTAPYYDNSEIVLGTALKALEHEFPRSTYQLITKVGRYGPAPSDFDYSPTALRASVRRSLRRLHTEYLDVVYLHDVEFVAPCIAPRAEGNHAAALGAEATAYGLAPGQPSTADGVPRTPGSDESVLGAIEALRALQADGLIRHVGISGLPLPALLRTAQLVLARTGRPLDAVQAYAHLTLQNGTLIAFANALRTRARVAQVLAASPLGMGLLAPPPAPPPWHPAPRAVLDAAREAVQVVGEGEVAAVAVAWSVRTAQAGDGGGGQIQNDGGAEGRMPVVVGMSDLREVHAAVEAWRWARDVGRQEELESKASLARNVFERTRTAGWTWPSGNWV